MTPFNLLQKLESPTALLFAERLGHALDLLSCSRDKEKRINKLSADFGISTPTAKAWLNGLDNPGNEVHFKIANTYKVDYNWLSTGVGEPIHGKHSLSGLHSIPQIPYDSVWNYQKLIRSIWIPNRMAIDIECSQSSFAVYIGFEELEPSLFPKDSYFIIDPQAPVKEQDIVLAVIKANRTTLCGHFIQKDEDRVILPLKVNSKPYYLDEEDKIIGPALTIITYFVTS